MGRAYFITATGTDSGKTFVAEGLTRALRERGQQVRALKPVMSGADPASSAASDAARLLAACGSQVTAAAVAGISPWRFAAPLSPDRAAVLAGRRIDFDELVGWCRTEVASHAGITLIEGIGGVMVPLDECHTVREWIAALDLPVLLVAGTYLGAISHTLAALAALREAGVVPAVIVVNESSGGVNVDDTLASLVPHVAGLSLLMLARGGDGLDAIAEFLLKGCR